MAMEVHELKTHRPFYGLIRDGLKTWELCRNDRKFKVGDLLYLREYNPVEAEYTGYSQFVEVMSVTADVPEGLDKGFVIMDIALRVLVPA